MGKRDMSSKLLTKCKATIRNMCKKTQHTKLVLHFYNVQIHLHVCRTSGLVVFEILFFFFVCF